MSVREFAGCGGSISQAADVWLSRTHDQISVLDITTWNLISHHNLWKFLTHLYDKNGFLHSVCVCVCVPHSRRDAPQHTNQLDHWELPIILLQNHEPWQDYFYFPVIRLFSLYLFRESLAGENKCQYFRYHDRSYNKQHLEKKRACFLKMMWEKKQRPLLLSGKFLSKDIHVLTTIYQF